MVVGSVLGCNLQLIIDVLGVINLIPQKNVQLLSQLSTC